MLVWGNRLKRPTDKTVRRDRAVTEGGSGASPEGFTSDEGQLCKARLSKSNQVQLFLIFFSSGHWAEPHQDVVTVTSKGVAVNTNACHQSFCSKVMFLKWEAERDYCELLLYSYHEAFLFFSFFFSIFCYFSSLFCFCFVFCQPLPMSINHSISLC